MLGVREEDALENFVGVSLRKQPPSERKTTRKKITICIPANYYSDNLFEGTGYQTRKLPTKRLNGFHGEGSLDNEAIQD